MTSRERGSRAGSPDLRRSWKARYSWVWKEREEGEEERRRKTEGGEEGGRREKRGSLGSRVRVWERRERERANSRIEGRREVLRRAMKKPRRVVEGAVVGGRRRRREGRWRRPRGS